MFFSIGPLELALTLALALPAALLFLRRSPWSKPVAIAAAASLFASVLSPADVLSTILVGVALLAFYTFGTRYGSKRRPDVA